MGTGKHGRRGYYKNLRRDDSGLAWGDSGGNGEEQTHSRLFRTKIHEIRSLIRYGDERKDIKGNFKVS